MKKKILNILGIYIALIVTFLIAMTISYSIPNTRINWHVSDSIEQLKSEGLYPKPFFGSNAAQLDNFTDAWMLNLAISADTKHPIKSSLENPHRVTEQYDTGEYDKIENLEKSLYNDEVKTMSYGRYWHGYLAVLRPLLVFLDYTEIRFVNMLVLPMLFIAVNCLLKRELGTKIMMSFFFAIMSVMFLIVPMSLQFSSMFYVMFIGMIAILTLHKKIKKEELSIYIFFVIGSVASFLDLLTVPLITLGIPLITYILLIKHKSASKNLIEVIKCSIIWALGYGITWASKWVIASVVLKENKVQEAISQILVRTSDTSGDTVITGMDVISKNTDLILNSLTSKILLLVLVIWIISMIFLRKGIREIIKVTPILLIGMMPFVWYILLKNHSYMHYWFTYRSLCVTIFSLLAFMAYCIDTEKLKRKLGKIIWNI